MILGALRYDRLRFGRVTHRELVMGSIDGVRNNRGNQGHDALAQVSFKPKPRNTPVSTSSSTDRPRPTLRQLNMIARLKLDIDPEHRQHFERVAREMYIYRPVNSPSALSEPPGLRTELDNFLDLIL
jgi:hypothetical protein